MIAGAVMTQPTHAPSDCRMPVSYVFDGRLLALRMIGAYVPADIRAALAMALRDPRAPDIQGMLFDVSESESIARRTPQEVRAMAAFLAHNAPAFGGRLALVATTDVGYGLMRIGGADVDSAGVSVRTFRSVDEAIVWLAS